MTGRRRQLPRQARVVLVVLWAVILPAAVGVLAVRATGESARTKRAVEAAAVELQREIRADCAFKWDLADLPRTVRPRGAGLVKIAADARAAYIGKGCQAGGGPPPPPIYTPDPAPSPTR